MAVDIFYISSKFCTKKEQKEREWGIQHTTKRKEKKIFFSLINHSMVKTIERLSISCDRIGKAIFVSLFFFSFFFAYKYPIIKVRRHQAHLQKEKIEGWKFYSKNRFNISILLYFEESVEIIACMVPFKSSPQTTKWSWAHGTMFPLSSCWDSKQSTLQMQISTRKVYKWNYHSSMVMIW